jgi:hypothetical protein
MNDKKLNEAIYECYCLMYEHSEPKGDFNKLIETATLNEYNQKIIPFNDYEINENTYDEIINAVIKSFKIPKHQQQMFKNTIALGCSPRFKKI